VHTLFLSFLFFSFLFFLFFFPAKLVRLCASTVPWRIVRGDLAGAPRRRGSAGWQPVSNLAEALLDTGGNFLQLH
jgi:hypothetical protein